MRALALEHLRPDPVGIFGEVLEERGVTVDRVMLDEGERLPDWRRYDLVVAMGGGMSVWEDDEFPWLVEEKRTVQEAVLAGVPYFGICFGAQLLAAVFGGRSYRGPEPELGVNQVFLTAAARRDPVFRGFPPDLEVVEWHSNHFDLPPGAVRLARSPRYHNQAIRYGRVAYGIQCHLEPSLEDIREWLALMPVTAIFEARHGVGSVESMLEEYEVFVPQLQDTGRQLFGRWLEHALALGGLASAANAARLLQGQESSQRGDLLGRDDERARLEAALDAARRGDGAVIVLRGEGGVGKTALLDDAVARARNLRVLRVAGTDSEVEMPFAGLAALCQPLTGLLGKLSPARAEALAGALRMDVAPTTHDRFAIYAGALALVTVAADETPLLLVVDDGHWLDDASAEAIAFIARRLGTDGIALLIATEADDDFLGSPELRLRGLDRPAARALLDTRYGNALAPDVAELVVEAAAGDPLTLLELPLALTEEQRAGTVPVGDDLPASAEWAFLQRIESLPPDARRALLIAALADDDRLELLNRACGVAGVKMDLATAEAAGLVRQEDGKVKFRHGVARTAVAYSAARTERRAAHATLAETTAGDVRLWHLAYASAGPDEVVAAGIQRVASGARELRAYGVAARALELAARLTPDGEARAERLLAAAESAHLAGHVNAALDHLQAGLRHATAPDLRAAIEHMRSRVLARSGSAGRARDALAGAAARYERDNPAKAAEMLADAVLPALRAGSPVEARRLARRAMRLAAGTGGREGLKITLMLGIALVFAGDYAEGTELVEAAADSDQGEHDLQFGAYLGAGLAAAGRKDRARTTLERVLAQARSEGAVAIMPFALVRLAGVELDLGRWGAAATALHEALPLAQETGQSADRGLALGTLAWLEAAQGQADSCRAHVEEALELAGRLGSGSSIDRAAAALGLLELGLRRPESAIPHLRDVRRFQEENGWPDAALTPHRMPDLVEACVMSGRTDEAFDALESFADEARRIGRPSADAATARCRALLADVDAFDAPFSEALRATEETTGAFERARTQLLYGDRLTTARRADEAGIHLTAALVTFERLGADPWANRAREVLSDAGIVPPHPTPGPLDRLTPRELQVALAVAQGASPENLGELQLLGPRTARGHLVSALIKLGLDSPTQLPSVFSASEAL